jgi:EmrB/QacA subfamily drug resistance transporter
MSSGAAAGLGGMTAETHTARQRWIALMVLCAGVLMIVLDMTIVNVALPSIQSDLGFSQAGLAWVVNAYLIAFGGLLLLAGRLGDLVSRRGVFLAGLGVFTLASLACGLATSEGMLVAARFVQGIGGAMTSAVVLGMIVTMFPQPRDQAKAIGVYGFVASAGGSIGLLVGGVITEVISWHWIFFVNLPVGVVTAALALRLLPADKGIGLRQGADVPGALLITSGLMLAVYTIVSPAAELGWGAARTLVLGALAVALLVGFFVREATAANPLIPLRIFRSRTVSAANGIQALVVVGMFGQGFLGALYLQRVLGYSALEIGLAFLPLTLVMGTMSLRYGPRAAMRFGARNTLVGGLVLVVAGLVCFAQVGVDSTYVGTLLPAMLLMGTGCGISFPAVMQLAMSGSTPADAGLASGLVNTTVQVGGALGLAVVATLAATRTASQLAAGAPEAVALTDGYRLAFLIGAACVAAATTIALTVLPRTDHARAPHAAPEPTTA